MEARNERLDFGDVVVRFGISHQPDVPIDYLDIEIFSDTNTGFVCKTRINCITRNDIDVLCDRLRALKKDIKHDVRQCGKQ